MKVIDSNESSDSIIRRKFLS